MANPTNLQHLQQVCEKSTNMSEKLKACQQLQQLMGQAPGPNVNNPKPQAFAEGGFAVPPTAEFDIPMEEEMPAEETLFDKAEAILSEEELAIFDEHMADPALYEIVEKLMGSTFEGEGPVEGPGTETSDSIDAKLSDGEFVFTAKATKQIGVDKLRKMMSKAEQEYDQSMMQQDAASMEGFACGGFVHRRK